MIVPGLVSVTFREKTVEEILQISISCGLEAIEWSENIHVFPGDEEGANQLYRKTIESGIQIAAYGSYFRLLENERPAEVFLQSLISAKALHAPIIRVWAGVRSSSEVSTVYRNRLTEEAIQIASLAEREGIQVALEWHRGTLTDNNESAMLLLDEVNHPNLFCLWQPTEGLSMNERCAGLHELAVRKKLLNLHTYYWKEGRRMPFSEGMHEWRQYLAQIDDHENRYALLEFVKDDNVEQLMSDALALKQLLKGNIG
ncbi:sugar phosphate isomerase/epimerase [Paenibacillus sp. N3.4]|uniref:sugar phosphate isomerase/epimerase family protein n=1 Tax=Paenibacillus sp. N3.4 TaxID=2603222 RepID=UPI0011CC709A|nr:TIM barrel protein [Paenibacillus sp. N3.4]TXK83967.1 TIM barrel protein [Paenibacillus sp. N3.4]